TATPAQEADDSLSPYPSDWDAHLQLQKHEHDALCATHRVEMKVGWVPGRANGIGNEAAHALASKSENDRS
ncbi:hypothetical protein HPB47_010266, partial [Ixodes persulcatus]